PQGVTRSGLEPTATPAERGGTALLLAGAIRCEHDPVRDAFHQARPAVIERPESLGRRPNSERAPAELQRRVEMPVDCPPSGHSDKPDPVDDVRSLLKIQGDVVEPLQPPSSTLR